MRENLPLAGASNNMTCNNESELCLPDGARTTLCSLRSFTRLKEPNHVSIRRAEVTDDMEVSDCESEKSFHTARSVWDVECDESGRSTEEILDDNLAYTQKSLDDLRQRLRAKAQEYGRIHELALKRNSAIAIENMKRGKGRKSSNQPHRRREARQERVDRYRQAKEEREDRYRQAKEKREDRYRQAKEEREARLAKRVQRRSTRLRYKAMIERVCASDNPTVIDLTSDDDGDDESITLQRKKHACKSDRTSKRRKHARYFSTINVPSYDQTLVSEVVHKTSNGEFKFVSFKKSTDQNNDKKEIEASIPEEDTPPHSYPRFTPYEGISSSLGLRDETISHCLLPASKKEDTLCPNECSGIECDPQCPYTHFADYNKKVTTGLNDREVNEPSQVFCPNDFADARCFNFNCPYAHV